MHSREQREAAATQERDIRRQVDESIGIRTRVQALNEQLFDARAEAESLSGALARARQRAEAEQRLAATEAE